MSNFPLSVMWQRKNAMGDNMGLNEGKKIGTQAKRSLTVHFPPVSSNEKKTMYTTRISFSHNQPAFPLPSLLTISVISGFGVIPFGFGVYRSSYQRVTRLVTRRKT